MRVSLGRVSLGLVSGLLIPALTVLPALGAWSLAGIVVAACALLGMRGCQAVAGLLLGFVWASWNIQSLLDARLPECVSATDRLVEAVILDDPVPLGVRPAAESLRFRVAVHGDDTVAARDDGASACVDLQGAMLRLSWYRAPGTHEPLRGQRWRLRIRVKPPWGYQNPGGFDFERWVLGKRLQGTGYVRSGSLLAEAQPSLGERFRKRLRHALSAGHLSSGGVLFALVTGDASALTAAQWERLRATGTIHLMVVSGLHVGLVAGLGYLLGGWLVRLLPPSLLWLPARRAGALGGVSVAACFVLFTGAGVPAVRALCMAAVAFWALAVGRRVRVPDLLLASLGAVLVVDPVAVHQQGFWLSFCAVAALALQYTGWRGPHSVWRNLATTQVALFVGLTPVLAVLNGQVPVVAMPANMLVVPVMSVLVIPLALISAALLAVAPQIAGFGFYLADVVLRWLLQLIDVLAQAPVLDIIPAPWFAGLSLVSAGLLLRGHGWRNQLVAWLLWPCWCLPPAMGLSGADFRVTALDVGQGSSILVDTRHHRLLFDAGPRYPSGFDLGSAVVVPSIVATGPRRLDAMVISHPDLDHRGGAGAVLSAVPVTRVFHSRAGRDSEVCVAGIAWVWDGVTFRFLNPRAGGRLGNDNDGSCVLEIANGRERVLLPGDIGAAVERMLVADARPVRLLLAPHHGSNSSSSKRFLRALEPDLVFVSAGKGNRYGHPHAAVIGRYRAIGARIYVTGTSGALVWESARPRAVQRYRFARGGYWTSGR